MYYLQRPRCTQSGFCTGEASDVFTPMTVVRMALPSQRAVKLQGWNRCMRGGHATRPEMAIDKHHGHINYNIHKHSGHINYNIDGAEGSVEVWRVGGDCTPQRHERARRRRAARCGQPLLRNARGQFGNESLLEPLGGCECSCWSRWVGVRACRSLAPHRRICGLQPRLDLPGGSSALVRRTQAPSTSPSPSPSPSPRRS